MGDQQMCKTKGSFKGLLVVGVAAVLCGYVLAGEPSTQRDQDKAKQPTQRQTQPSTQQQTQQQRQQASQQGMDAQMMSGKLHRTSKLIGKEVKDAQNEDLGSIYDLVLTSDHQQVSYAALSSGGTWGMGAKYYAVPWSAFQVNAQGDITTSLNKNQLDQMAAFDRDNWPAQANAQLTSSIGQGAMSRPSWQTDTQRQSTTDQTRDRSTTDTGQTRPGQTTDRVGGQQGTSDTDRTTDRPGSQTGAGAQAGTTTQRPTATDTTRDRQMTGRMGTTTGSGATAMNRDVQFRRVSNITGTSVRNAEGEDIGDIEDFVIDASQGQVAYTVISFGGFWGIGEKFAAVPISAVDLQPRRNIAKLDADRQTLEKIAFDPDEFPDLSNSQYAQQLHEVFDADPYWIVLGFVSPEQDPAASQRAWGTESQFAKHFDAKNVTTIQGTVQSIGSFLPEGAAPGSPGGMRIRVTTDDGNLVTVYAGPQWYAQQNDFYVKPGDKINVTGSQTKIGWRPVLVASQIQAGDRTLRLRNEAGLPLWQSQPTGQGQQQRQSTTPSQRPGQSGQQGSTGGTGTTGGAGSTSGAGQGPQPDDR
jgi:sporulation protein YlmC with PRC-barrel domain